MNRRRIVLAVVAIAVLSLSAGAFCFVNIGRWLIVRDEPPESLDVLVTFAGDLDRFSYSKSLIQKYPEAWWILSSTRLPAFDTLSLTTIQRRNLAIESIDTSRLFVLDTATSTYGELDALTRWLAVHEDTLRATKRSPGDSLRIGLVTSPYHTRRTTAYARRIIETPPAKLYSLPVPLEQCRFSPHHPARWWRHEHDAVFVVTEIIKLVYYWFKY